MSFNVSLVRLDRVWFSDCLLAYDLPGVCELMGTTARHWTAPPSSLATFVETALVSRSPISSQKIAGSVRACYSLNHRLEKMLNICFGSGEAIKLVPRDTVLSTMFISGPDEILQQLRPGGGFYLERIQKKTAA